MAVTSIWPINSRAKNVIDYVQNPEKTTERTAANSASLHIVKGVLEYAEDEMKTERRMFVTGINCDEEFAAKQFQDTKDFWGKTDGRVCYHAYQSFRPGEVTAEQAHTIGVELANRLWGDRFEVVVATHLNTNHYHNHFVINSVAFKDGYKFNNNHAAYAAMREMSDKLCREYGLSVPDAEKSRKCRSEWQAEKNGLPTIRSLIRADIDRAIAASETGEQFYATMMSMGYQFKTGVKYPGLKPPGAKGFFRFYKLGSGYDLSEIKARIARNMKPVQPFPDAERECIRKAKRPSRHATGLKALYFYYCYQLNTIVSHPASLTRIPQCLRDDIIHLDRLSAEAKLLAEANIETREELALYRMRTESEIAKLSDDRRLLRNEQLQAKRDGNATAYEASRQKIAHISGKLKKLRAQIKLCTDIDERSESLAEKMEQLEAEIDEEQEVNEHEFDRRCGRTGNAYIAPGR